MAYGIIGYSAVGAFTPGSTAQPSGSIWGDCSSAELLDEGIGYFVYETFIAGTTLPNFASGGTGGTFVIDPVLPKILDIKVAATTGDVAGFWTQPIGTITPGSGYKFWFETNVSWYNVATVQASFIGLVGASSGTALSGSTVIAASATKASNTLASTSMIGFWQHGDTPNQLDLISQSGSTGVVTTLAANITNAASITANGGSVGNLTNSTFVKLGLRYDGQQYLYAYVNGVQAAKVAISAVQDIVNPYAATFSTTTGANTALVDGMSFFRAAAKVY